ncbi:MAB_1171c family putative transporter [Streptomyces sp. NPDC090054]|uniref:MAB_1171c family putative transporter n=1 Tax=Streptomyces sp. NPDC090054 TaxID=3365933 RepID=UPI00380C7046
MSDLGFQLPAVIGFLAALGRLPGLLRNPHDPLLRAVVAFLLTTSGAFFLGAVPMLAKVNAATGVPNFAVPLGHAMLMASSGTGIVLIINWRGGPPESIRRATHRALGCYGAVGLALVGLFLLGEAPVERLRDFDTHYATTPYLREMTLLLLAAHTAAALVMYSLCRRWLREVTGELRVGLALMVTGHWCTVGHAVCTFAAVAARWAGTDCDFLSTHAARPLGRAASSLVICGFVLPLLVQRFAGPWRDWSGYRRLGPLARLLTGLTPATTTVRMPLFSCLGVRRLQRESNIHDGLLTLNPYFDLALRAAALDAALAGGADAGDAAAVADAAMVTAAVRALRADPERCVIAHTRALQDDPGGCRDLVRTSRALSRLPAAARPGLRVGGGPAAGGCTP